MDRNAQRELMQELLNNPKHKGLTDEQLNKSVKSIVDSCDDNFNIYIGIENNIITEAKFDGEGCAISFSSTEALLDSIQGKDIKEANIIVDKFLSLINSEITETGIDALDVFEIIQAHVSRKKCAMAAVDAIKGEIK